MVCGKYIKNKAVRITNGAIKGDHWAEHAVVGMAHESCFASAVDSPDIVIDELRRVIHESHPGRTTP